MKKFYSWLKRNVADIERISDAIAASTCIAAGTAILFGTGYALKRNLPPYENDAEESALVVPTALFVNAPEELPPEPEVIQEVEKSLPEEVSQPEEITVPEVPQEAPKAEEEVQEVQEEKVEAPEEPAPAPETNPPPAQILAEQEELRAAKQTLYGTLTAAIHRKKFYSSAAMRLKLTGTVFMKIRISADGRIADYELCGDGNPRLKANALEIVRRTAEDFQVLDAPENSLPEEFIVPIEFNLN